MAYDLSKWDGNGLVKIATQMQIEDYLPKPIVETAVPYDSVWDVYNANGADTSYLEKEME